jgi:hypothetical protein
MKSTRVTALVFACAALQIRSLAFAADPLSLYVGGGIGQSSVRDDRVAFTSPFVVPQIYDFDQHHTAWKVMLGVHPIPVLGAELEYLDFGDPSVNSTFKGFPLQADAQVKGPALFAVGYLPLPLPLLDLYGKVGLAHLQTRVAASNVGHPICAPDLACPDIVWIPGVYHANETHSSLAYGAGERTEWRPGSGVAGRHLGLLGQAMMPVTPRPFGMGSMLSLHNKEGASW